MRHPTRSQNQAALETNNAQIVACRRCPRLIEWCEQVAVDKRAAFRDDEYWGRPVPSFGDPSARILVLGLAPAAHGANRTGRMFTGDRSGDWLFRSMHAAGLANQPQSVSASDGLTLSDAWITATAHCAPPANKPTLAERRECAPYLATELAVLQPTVIVCLGAMGWNAALDHFGVRPRPRFGHCAEHRIDSHLLSGVAGGGDVTLLASFHPSQQNTFTKRLTEPMLDAVFRRAVELAGRTDPAHR